MSKLAKKDSRNWLIYLLYVRNEPEECLKLIEEILKETNERNDFASYVKGLIFRSQGQIPESLELFR